jgi:threonine/homoserine/homoserine lactone efflux protein
VDVASLLTLLVLALALAVQPWSVLAAVLLVASKGGVTKAMAYVAGWVLALMVVAIATVALGQLGAGCVRHRAGWLVAGQITTSCRGQVGRAAKVDGSA